MKYRNKLFKEVLIIKTKYQKASISKKIAEKLGKEGKRRFRLQDEENQTSFLHAFIAVIEIG